MFKYLQGNNRVVSIQLPVEPLSDCILNGHFLKMATSSVETNDLLWLRKFFYCNDTLIVVFMKSLVHFWH